MNRPMIVGGTEHDYDHLLTSVGVEPPPPPQHYAPPPAPEHYYPQHQMHPAHHGHHGHGHPGGHPGHHPQHAGYLPAPQYAPPPQPIVLQPAPQPQRHVVNDPPAKARDFPIGFTSQNPIPPNSPPVEIEVKPQALFKGRRLSVAHSIAKNFVIVDIKVGTNPQQGATGEMPAESFSSNAVDTRMNFDTAAPGTTITIRVRNISNTPSLFMATLFGDVLI